MDTFDRPEHEFAYLGWLAAHPDGFVVNTSRPKASAGYLKLHAATCRSISELQPRYRHFTGGAYQKACSTDRAELERWARGIGGRLDPCGRCRP